MFKNDVLQQICTVKFHPKTNHFAIKQSKAKNVQKNIFGS